MKSFSLALLVATVAAETGYTCTNPAGDAAWTTHTEADSGTTLSSADTAAKCTAAAKTIAEADKSNDFCASFTDTAKVEADAEADPVVEARDASTVCALLEKATATDADIRAAKATEDGITYNAWAWGAGAALDTMADIAAAEEETTTDTTTVVEELLGATALYQGFAASAIMVAMMA